MRKTTFSKKKQDLEDMIQAILVRNPDLHYYQGFHDICAVLLIVLMDDKLAFAVAEAIAQRQLRTAMQETLEPVVQQLVLMFKLLYHVDLELFDLLRQLEIPVYFALSWHITWFAHDVDDPIVRSRLFDAFIASSPLLPIYVSTAVCANRVQALTVFYRSLYSKTRKSSWTCPKRSRMSCTVSSRDSLNRPNPTGSVC